LLISGSGKDTLRKKEVKNQKTIFEVGAEKNIENKKMSYYYLFHLKK
jgi:hypothetical protein